MYKLIIAEQGMKKTNNYVKVLKKYNIEINKMHATINKNYCLKLNLELIVCLDLVVCFLKLTFALLIYK